MEAKDYLNSDQQSLDVKLSGRMADIAEEISTLSAKKELSDDEVVRFEELSTEFEDVEKQQVDLHRSSKAVYIKKQAARADRVYRGDATFDTDPLGEPRSVEDRGGFRDPFALEEIRAYPGDESAQKTELRARALSAIEKMDGANSRTREVMTDLVEKWDDARGSLSKQLLVTGSPAYLRAFQKAMTNRQHTMSDNERMALQRAMSLTDSAGGYLIPFQLDPTVINTSNGSLNQIRQAAREVVATGDVWNGVSAGETSWSWDAEAAEVSDDASTFAQPSITIHKGRGFVPISEEAFADEANVANEVARLLAAGKDTLESTAFATGSGSGQPFGIVTALNTTGQVVSATTNNSFGLVDVYQLDEGLPARYRVNASWLANRSIYNDIRQFDTAGGAALWERLGNDVPPLLLGRNAYEAEAMDGAIATADDYVLVFGDFDNYVIADRVGVTVDFIPHLFHTTTNRPSGQKGWYAYYRVGADSVNNGAFQILKV